VWPGKGPARLSIRTAPFCLFFRWREVLNLRKEYYSQHTSSGTEPTTLENISILHHITLLFGLRLCIIAHFMLITYLSYWQKRKKYVIELRKKKGNGGCPNHLLG
jgi:hypothetical protein